MRPLTTILFGLLVFATLALRGQPWEVQKAVDWAEIGWYAGFNYVPSYAVNSIEQWQAGDFDPECIERELGWGSELGYCAVRVFIPYVLWAHDADELFANFDRFLDICEAKQLRVVPVLFDDCAFGYPPQLTGVPGKQRKPQPGVILSSWVPSPGQAIVYDDAGLAKMRAYLHAWLQRYGEDTRILFWDLFNEPGNTSGVGTPPVLQFIFFEAWQVRPSQPLTVGIWSSDAKVNSVLYTHCDILSFHSYTGAKQLAPQLDFYQKQPRPVVCTEWFARPLGSDIETDLPLFRNADIPCIQWGLVNGRTQTQFPWTNHLGDPVAPEGWFHDLLHTDGTAYRAEEVEFIRKFLTPNSSQN